MVRGTEVSYRPRWVVALESLMRQANFIAFIRIYVNTAEEIAEHQGPQQLVFEREGIHRLRRARRQAPPVTL